VATLQGRALASKSSYIGRYQAGVEAESWKRDVDVWFELSMTGIQTSLLDAAEGSVYNPGLRDPTLHDLAAGSGGKGILP